GAPSGGSEACTIEGVTLSDGARKMLVRGGHNPHFFASSNAIGHLVYFNKATLFAIPFDPVAMETRGTAVPVVDDVASSALTGSGLLDGSGPGTLIYRRSHGDLSAVTTVQWVDSSGKKEPLLGGRGNYQSPRLSPDGRRMLLLIRDGANQDLWVFDPARDALTRLTFGGLNASPAWSS